MLCLIGIVGLVGMQSGCAARTVRSGFINRSGIEVDLVREVKGFATQSRGFEHPAIISVPRLSNILGAIEVETRDESGVTVRQSAFHREIIQETATALAEAFAEASPDDELGVQVIRKVMHYGVFNKKYLTSFLAYIDEGHLYLVLRRIDWFVSSNFKRDTFPKARRDYRPMKFRVVSGEPLFYAGPQTLEIAWRDPAFSQKFTLPGSSKGTKRRREVLLQSPLPKTERDVLEAPSTGIGIDELTPEQLRALANLEEDRQKGVITESAYQRAKRQLLRRR